MDLVNKYVYIIEGATRVDHIKHYTRFDRLEYILYDTYYKVAQEDNDKVLLSQNGRPPYVGWFYKKDIGGTHE
jgi:hypothetical protein